MLRQPLHTNLTPPCPGQVLSSPLLSVLAAPSSALELTALWECWGGCHSTLSPSQRPWIGPDPPACPSIPPIMEPAGHTERVPGLCLQPWEELVASSAPQQLCRQPHHPEGTASSSSSHFLAPW